MITYQMTFRFVRFLYSFTDNKMIWKFLNLKNGLSDIIHFVF